MKGLLLFICLLGGGASLGAEEARWQQVLLLDWFYPGEEAYAALRAASLEVGANDWISQRMARGEKIPQASARELAFKLSQDPRLSPMNQERLKTLLADEAELLKGTSVNSTAGKARTLSEAFDAMSRRMDEIDKVFDSNRYGKGSNPALTLNTNTGFRLAAPAGMIQGHLMSNYFAGAEGVFSGALDKATYSVTLGIKLDNNDGSGYNTASPPTAAYGYFPSFVYGTYSAGFNFVIPLGEGGFEVNLGNTVFVRLSPLVYSTVLPSSRDLFYVEVRDSYRNSKDIKELDLNYPWDNKQTKGIYLRRQGAAWWWPFSVTQFVYAPDFQFWETWNPKVNTSALRLDEELGPHFDFIDASLIYGVGGFSTTDGDQMRGAVQTNNPAQGSDFGGLGTEISFSNGASLKGEWVASHYQIQPAGTTNPAAPIYGFDDSASFATYAMPLGPVQVVAEGAYGGPNFLTSAHRANRLQAGSTQDSFWGATPPDAPSPRTFQNAQFPFKLGWVTLINQPSAISNNSQRYTLKGEWHGSWISAGVYDGTVSQLVPSGPYVVTSPFIEGNSANGYGWFRLLGQSYNPPPAPAVNLEPVAAPDKYLWRFNNPTDAMSLTVPAAAIINSTGTKEQVHWQEIAQLDYRVTQFSLLLSQNGVGDNRVMPDSLKVLNYLGGTLRFDIRSLLGRVKPFELVVVGEVRDVGPQMGLPAFDDSNYFNQTYIVGFLTLGLNDYISLIGMAGYETWKSKQSYFPLFNQVKELGIGADFKLDPFLTGLGLTVRASMMNFEDLYIAKKELSLMTIAVGTNLVY